VILDESYNAAPEAMIAALHLLSETPAKRRIAILGPMRELGSFDQEIYAHLGQILTELALDQIWLLDPQREMSGVPYTQHFHSHAEVVTFALNYSQPGDCYLCKAAHSVGLEQVVLPLAQAWSPSNREIP